MIDIWNIAGLFVVAVLAGCLDTLAGGGGLLTVPYLLSAGFAPVNALAINKFQGSFGVLAASVRFWRLGLLQPATMVGPFIGALVGAAIGTATVTMIDPEKIKTYVPILLLMVAGYFLLSPKLPDHDRAPKITMFWLVGCVAPVIGFYDGFIGPGTGSFFMLALVALFGQNIRRATANTKLLNLASNLASLAVFIVGGHVILLPAMVMAAGQVIGARIGARLVVGKAVVLIKPLIVIMCVLMSCRLLGVFEGLFS